MKLYFFNKILLSVLNSKISFISAKPMPLIPGQTLIQPNKFKSILIQYIKHFAIKINIDPFRIYHKEKISTETIITTFIDSLNDIAAKLIDSNQIQYSLFKEKIFSSTLTDYTIAEPKYRTKQRRETNKKQEKAKLRNNAMEVKKKIIRRDIRCNKKYDKVIGNNFYSVTIPYKCNLMIKYEFISFNPLLIKKVTLQK